MKKLQKQIETLCKAYIRDEGDRISKDRFKCYIREDKKDEYSCLVDNDGLSYDSVYCIEIKRSEDGILKVTNKY